jgi:hypothetical protein
VGICWEEKAFHPEGEADNGSRYSELESGG